MMKNERIMTKIWSKYLTIPLLFLTVLTAGCQTDVQDENSLVGTDCLKEAVEETASCYSSNTNSEDCFFCGDGKGTLLSVYRGQKNIGVIDLNTLDLAPIIINRYDNLGVLIEKPENGTTTHVTNMGENGFFFSVTADTNRGYARGQLLFGQNETLEMEKAASHLCSDCLERVMDCCWSDTPLGMGVINFGTGEIRLFEENISAFTFGDYYISCDEQNSDEGGRRNMSLLVFYCPERY